MVFSHDGQVIASADVEGNIKLWDAATAKLLRSYSTAYKLHQISYSADGSSIFIVGRDTGESKDILLRLDLRSNNIERLPPISEDVTCYDRAAFSPDGSTIAVERDCRPHLQSLNTITVWNTRTAHIAHILSGHRQGIFKVAFSRDGRTLASSGLDETTRLWDIESERLLLVLRGHTGWEDDIVFDPQKPIIGTCNSAGGQLRLWSTTSGRLLHTMSASSGSCNSIAFSPNGKMIASGGQHPEVKVWDAETGQPLYELKGHDEAVLSVAFSPDGTLLASGSADKTVKVWNLSALHKASDSIAVTPVDNRGQKEAPGILEKEPELLILTQQFTDDEILHLSTEYAQKVQAIQSKMASVQDPELRNRIASEEWSMVDKATYINSERKKLSDAFPVELRKMRERYRSDLFEIGHINYSADDYLKIEPMPLSVVQVNDEWRVNVDLQTMDRVYAKFREIARDDIQNAANQQVQSCEQRLETFCHNLGGDSSRCSSASERERLLEEFGEGGICAATQTPADELFRQVEQDLRRSRIVLAGRGDIVSHRIDGLALIDESTATQLLEIPISAFQGDMNWKGF